jgi:16S rRNA (uracil1498-N3)-methyltransferase
MRGVTLVACATKGDKLDDVVRAATALGASAISVVESDRSVPELGAGAARRFARFRAIAVDAARQSGRGDLPELSGPGPLSEALGAFTAPDTLRLCLDPRAEQPLARVLAARGERPVVLLVGPEGGFAPEELAAAERAGFVAVALGRLVLRAELAAVAALAAVVAQSPMQNPEMQ